MKEKPTHTPTPWYFKNDPVISGHAHIYSDGKDTKDSEWPTVKITDGIDRHNAVFIVRAVNAHDQLVKERQFYKDREWELELTKNELLHYVRNYHESLKLHGHNNKPNCCKVSKAIAKAEAKSKV